jgi:hypothetical protein
MEINVGLVFFEELRESADDSSAVARIVIVRENSNSGLALENDAAGFFSVE